MSDQYLRNSKRPEDESVAALRLLGDMLGGEGAEFYKNTADPTDRVFEVRRNGKHAGFIEVTEQGEVVWIA